MILAFYAEIIFHAYFYALHILCILCVASLKFCISAHALIFPHTHFTHILTHTCLTPSNISSLLPAINNFCFWSLSLPSYSLPLSRVFAIRECPVLKQVSLWSTFDVQSADWFFKWICQFHLVGCKSIHNQKKLGLVGTTFSCNSSLYKIRKPNRTIKIILRYLGKIKVLSWSQGDPSITFLISIS